jgi:hypothetical protein
MCPQWRVAAHGWDVAGPDSRSRMPPSRPTLPAQVAAPAQRSNSGVRPSQAFSFVIVRQSEGSAVAASVRCKRAGHTPLRWKRPAAGAPFLDPKRQMRGSSMRGGRWRGSPNRDERRANSPIRGVRRVVPRPEASGAPFLDPRRQAHRSPDPRRHPPAIFRSETTDAPVP